MSGTLTMCSSSDLHIVNVQLKQNRPTQTKCLAEELRLQVSAPPATAGPKAFGPLSGAQNVTQLRCNVFRIWSDRNHGPICNGIQLIYIHIEREGFVSVLRVCVLRILNDFSSHSSNGCSGWGRLLCAYAHSRKCCGEHSR